MANAIGPNGPVQLDPASYDFDDLNLKISAALSGDDAGRPARVMAAINAAKQGGPPPGPTPVIDAARYMFWATRARFPSGALQTASSTDNYRMSKIVFNSPIHTVTNPRFHFSGFSCQEGGSSPQETILPGNAMIVDGVWVSVNGGPVVAFPVSGAASVSIASGAAGAWTDETALEIPPESVVTVFTLYHTASAEKQIPVYRIQSHRGERIWGAADAASLMPMLSTPNTPSTATLDTGFGQNQPGFYGPDMTVARGWDGKPVVLAVVDSIGEQRQEFALEADQRGNLGWFRRWLDFNDRTYRRTPHFMMGCPGSASARELATNAMMRWQILDQAAAFNTNSALPFTKAANQLGQNDLNSTYSTMQSNYVGFIDRFKARYPGIDMVPVGTLPRTTTTDGYTTRQNQTWSTGNEWAAITNNWGNGNKSQLEAYKEAGAGGRLTGYIDLRPYYADATYPGTWPPVPDLYTLTQQAGTDGTAAYTSIQLNTPPRLGDILYAGGTELYVNAVSGTGPYSVTVSSATTVIPAGTTMRPKASVEGVHPTPSAIQMIYAAVPQSKKVLFA